MSSTKPEVHNVSQRRWRRIEPRPRATCTKIWKNPQNRKYITYRNDAGEGSSHGRVQQAQKFGKNRACGYRDILADRQTDTQTQTYSSQYFSTAPAVEATIFSESIKSTTLKHFR